VKANEVLRPGEAGHLVLYLDTMHRDRAGKIEGCVPLFAGADEEPVRFCVKGFLDGVVFPQPNYVIRPAQQRARKIPPFHFDVVTHTKKDFKITNIMCASYGELRDVHSEGGTRTDTKMVEAKALSQVTADLGKMTISPEHYEAHDEVYVRTVEVPMRLEDSPKAFSGKVIVDYLLDKETLRAQMNLLVLGLENN
jgi:hypothetical protein